MKQERCLKVTSENRVCCCRRLLEPLNIYIYKLDRGKPWKKEESGDKSLDRSLMYLCL